MRTVGLLSIVWSGLIWAQPGSYDDLLSRARSALSARDYQAAAAATQQAIRMDDHRWEAYAVAANAYSGERLYDDAIGMLQMALPRAPEDRKQLVRDALQEVRRQMAGVRSPAPIDSSPVARPQSSPAISAPTQAEIVLWKSIENSGKIEDFRGYLERYPEGTYSTVARQRVDALTPLPYWLDPQTGLAWTRRDNGSDVNWNEASTYCQDLRLGGYSNWRLPAIEELAQIYDPSVAALPGNQIQLRIRGAYGFQEARNFGPPKVKTGIQLGTPGVLWSGTAKGSGEAWLFDFRTGKRESNKLGRRYFRTLCVRPSGR